MLPFDLHFHYVERLLILVFFKLNFVVETRIRSLYLIVVPRLRRACGLYSRTTFTKYFAFLLMWHEAERFSSNRPTIVFPSTSTDRCSLVSDEVASF